VRLLALTPIVVALGLGGVALAQPQTIVDPWGQADADSWFTKEAAPAAPLTTELKDPWAPPSEPPSPLPAPKRIDVIPLASVPSAARAVEVAPRGEVSVVDPWAPPIIASETPSLRAGSPRVTADRSRGAPWSERFVEIVDPWKRMPEFAATDRVRLIVDPWSR